MTSNWQVKEYNYCRLCNSTDIRTVLDFGETALANSYLNKEDLNNTEFKAPLRMFLCKCGSFQLRHTVNPDLLFKNYLYESSTSPVFKKHFENYAKSVSEKLNLQKEDIILEIGSNDNILLKPFKRLGFENLYGVDPAENLIKKCKEDGINLICEYFTKDLVVNKLQDLHNKISLVCANNVFAHSDNLKDIAEGIRLLLKDNGVFVFEVTYLLENVRKNYFDMQYHEHIFSHSVKPLVSFFENLGMTLFNVEEVTTHGGSIRCFVKKNEGNYKIDSNVDNLINKETNFGLYNIKTYFTWRDKIDKSKDRLLSLLLAVKNKGEKVWAYGCPAKLTTLFKVMGVDGFLVEKIVDDSPLKQNKYTPDSHIPIVNRKEFIKVQPENCLITAWNFSESIKQNNKDYQGNWIDVFEQYE